MTELFLEKFQGRTIKIPVFTALSDPKGKFPKFPQYKMMNLEELHLSDDYIYENGIFYSKEALAALNARAPPKCEITNLEEANALVQALAKLEMVPWEHTEGCNSRAEFTCQFLRIMGIPIDDIGKYFAYPEHAFKIKIGDKEVTWNYHVSPAIRIGTDWIILDPAMDPTKAFTPDAWLKRLQETSPKAAAETVAEKERGMQSIVHLQKNETLILRTKYGLNSTRVNNQHKQIYAFILEPEDILRHLKVQFQVMQLLQNDKTLFASKKLLSILNEVDQFFRLDPVAIFDRLGNWITNANLKKRPQDSLLSEFPSKEELYHYDPSIVFHSGISWIMQFSALRTALRFAKKYPELAIHQKYIEKNMNFIQERMQKEQMKKGTT